MKAFYPGNQLTGVRVQSCRPVFAGVMLQLEGSVHNETKYVSIDMTYIEALDMAKALIYAAHRHGDIAVRQTENMVKVMGKKVGKK